MLSARVVFFVAMTSKIKRFVSDPEGRVKSILQRGGPGQRFDLFGIHINLFTDSERISEEARLFLGSHAANSGGRGFDLFLKELTGKEGGELAGSLVEEGFKALPVEHGDLFITTEGAALLDTKEKIAVGSVLGRQEKGGPKKAASTVSLLHLLALRIMAGQGFLPLHASAVRTEKGALVMTGDSGAGKSSLSIALHRLGMPLLADDLVYLHLSSEGPLVGGHCQPAKLLLSDMTPEFEPHLAPELNARVAGKKLIDVRSLNPECANALFPVEAVIFISSEKSGSLEAAPFSHSEAIFRLLDSFTIEIKDHYRKTALDILSAMDKVSFYSMKRGGDLERMAETVHSLFGWRDEG